MSNLEPRDQQPYRVARRNVDAANSRRQSSRDCACQCQAAPVLWSAPVVYSDRDEPERQLTEPTSAHASRKALYLVICILVSLLTAFAGATLMRHSGCSWAITIYSGGATFGAALGLGLGVLNTLWPK